MNPNRNRVAGDLLDDADSREQVSLKDALHLLAELGKTGTLVSDGRKSCTKRLMWNCLLHTSMDVFLIEIIIISRRPMRRPLSLRRFFEAGTGTPLNSDSPSPSHGPPFRPHCSLGQWVLGAAAVLAGGHPASESATAPLSDSAPPRIKRQSGTMLRDQAGVALSVATAGHYYVV